MSKKDDEDLFRVVGIELPMRVKSDVKNRAAWKQMAQQVEATLNELSRGGYSISIHREFIPHGVLIVGQLPPKVLRTPFGDIQMRPGEPAKNDPEMSAPPHSAQARHLYMKLFARLQFVSDGASETTWNKVFDEVLKDAQPLDLIEVASLCKLHAKEHLGHDGCDLGEQLETVSMLLMERANLAIS